MSDESSFDESERLRKRREVALRNLRLFEGVSEWSFEQSDMRRADAPAPRLPADGDEPDAVTPDSNRLQTALVRGLLPFLPSPRHLDALSSDATLRPMSQLEQVAWRPLSSELRSPVRRSTRFFIANSVHASGPERLEFDTDGGRRVLSVEVVLETRQILMNMEHVQGLEETLLVELFVSPLRRFACREFASTVLEDGVALDVPEDVPLGSQDLFVRLGPAR